MANHAHPLAWIAALGGGYLAWRWLQGRGVLPAPAAVVAAPGPAAAAAPVLQPATGPIANPFDDLVWNHPEAALFEEYAAWMHRIPDAPGQAYWLDRIAMAKAAGESPYQLGAEINAAFANAPEALALKAAGD